MTSPVIRADGRIYTAVVIASAAVVGLQLVLMRCLAVASWHHLAYLIISTALLGFGASGTLLTLTGRRLALRLHGVMVCALLGLGLAAPACFRLAEALPIDTYQVMLQPRQAALLIVYHLIILVPFLLGAISIGLPLMACREQVARLYAVNMIGSGFGAAAAVGLMVLLPAEHLLWGVSAAAASAGLVVAMGSRRRLALWCGGVIALIGLLATARGPIAVDPYKPLAYYRQLAAQGQADLLAERRSPRGRIDVFDSPLAHQTLFASPQADLPPPQMTLLVDGISTAPIFRIRGPEGAAVMDQTPLAAIYRAFRPRRVLLLGEIGGANVWMARRLGADHITVVQADEQIVDLLRGKLAELAGHVLDRADVDVVVSDPRGFLDRSRDTFDLIQLVALESLGGGAPGVMALNQSSLATVEGIGRCLDRLSDRGVVAVVRGLREPPRDNVRLAATFVEALETRGVANCGNQLIQFRNYLAACTAATSRPLTAETRDRLERAIADMAMDLDWLPGMRDHQANHLDPRPGPPGSTLSYLDWAVRRILSPDRESFYRQWAFAVRPATDDCPFFFDFFRWRSLPEYRRSFGGNWLANLEWGYVVLIAALAWSTVAAIVLILLPLLWVRREPSSRGVRLATGVYFVGLGMGYMLIEMALIQEFTRVLAEPVFAVAVVLAAFLVFSGLGSDWIGRRRPDPAKRSSLPIITVIALAMLYLLAARHLVSAATAWSMPLRAAVCLSVAAIMAVPMGMPFPLGLMRLARRSPVLIPWAWGANGFASVVAAVLAVVLAMSFGFTAAICAGLLAYAVAALASRFLST
ncbi:MAG: hypothetical protein JXQ73_20575 [Phycisphaerae bacterium]|nr:hypothetical protein [Phycisphaerae bacterium]